MLMEKLNVSVLFASITRSYDLSDFFPFSMLKPTMTSNLPFFTSRLCTLYVATDAETLLHSTLDTLKDTLSMPQVFSARGCKAVTQTLFSPPGTPSLTMTASYGMFSLYATSSLCGRGMRRRTATATKLRIPYPMRLSLVAVAVLLL